jgi:hypothetical protein
LLLSGPLGPAPETILIDTRASESPNMAFRGLIRPHQAELTRFDQDPATPLLVRFRLVMTGMGDFFGLMKTDEGWKPYAGWADNGEFIFCSNLDASTGELINTRFETIYLRGKPRTAEAPKQKAILISLKQPLSDGQTAKSVKIDAINAQITSSMMTVFFAPDGSVLRFDPGPDGRFLGDPSHFFGSKGPQSGSKPAILPAP